jgi:hypothetical protein
MLRKIAIVGALVALSTAASACVVEGRVRSHAYVSAPSAELALVSPGVYVVADYSEPVFYTDGYYWLYRDGFWLRSYTYTGGWVRAGGVPYHIRRIHRPYAYVRYRPSARTYTYRAPARRGEAPRRVYQGRDRRDRVDVRDHRGERVRRRDHRR